ncbi:MAG: lysophospholipase [Acidobacteriota bacterium]
MRALLALALIGCAHAPDLPLRPDPAPPAGSTTEVVTARDGTQLLARRWAAQGDVRGVLVIMHGLKDYSARYASLASRAVAAGYVVYAFDLRGHGRSAGPRVAPGDWDDYVDDLDRFLTSVEQREPGKPVFLLGHSMGGAIAARAAEVHAPRLAGLIVSGPAIAIDAPPLLVAATRLSGFLTPSFPALKLDNHDFSSDPANAAVMDRDELVSNPPAPARTAAGLVEGMHEIWRDVDRLTMPVLAMHGSADRLTAPSGSRALVATAPAADKTLRIYDGYFHDLLHEPAGRGTHVEDDVLAWLGAHTGGPAVAAPAPYAGHLAGDPRGWTQAVELVGGAYEDTNHVSHLGGRFALELSRPAPIGWHGEVTIHAIRSVQMYAVRPVGIELRGGPVAIGVSGGGELLCGTSCSLEWSAGASLQLATPYVHASAFAQYDTALYLLGGSVRLPGDRAYWPRAHAGVGPIVTGGAVLRDGGTYEGFFVAAGLELYGAD